MSVMQGLHLASIDLNLALVLHVLLAERSVSRAAKRLGLSQSATSHALARLREVLGDPLVVRTSQGIAPTARAQAMVEQLGGAMALLEDAFVTKPDFDPRTAKRRFQLITTDYAELVLLPALVGDLNRRAPKVELRLQPMTSDALALLQRGDVDLVIGVLSPNDSATELRSTLLLEDRLVCVMRKRHPLLKKPKLTLADYTAARHVLIAPRGTPGGIVDDALAARGKARTIAVTVPHFLAAPHLVAATDLVLTVAERAAKVFERLLPLEIRTPPLELPRTRVSMIWHQRHDADPAHRWFREWLVNAAQ